MQYVLQLKKHILQWFFNGINVIYYFSFRKEHITLILIQNNVTYNIF